MRPTRKYCNVSCRVGAYKKRVRKNDNKVNAFIAPEHIFRAALLSVLANDEEFQDDKVLLGNLGTPEMIEAVRVLELEGFIIA